MAYHYLILSARLGIASDAPRRGGLLQDPMRACPAVAAVALEKMDP